MKDEMQQNNKIKRSFKSGITKLFFLVTFDDNRK